MLGCIEKGKDARAVWREEQAAFDVREAGAGDVVQAVGWAHHRV
jgi:hypothetical protein